MSIRVGIIGLHHGATLHLPAYAANAKYAVTAVCDRQPRLAEEVARTHRSARWYTDPAQLIAAPDVDLISLATPPRGHVSLATAAMKAGKHVLIETPLACNAAEVRELMGLWRLRRIGVPAFALRYTPHVRVADDLLAQKKIGRPQLLRVDLFSDFLAQADPGYRWMWDADYGGGVLANIIATVFDLARRWFGPVREVTANLTTLLRPRLPEASGRLADDTAFVTLGFENGLLAHFNASAATAWCQSHMELHGSEGSLYFNGLGEEVSLAPMSDGPVEMPVMPEAYLEQSRGRVGLAGGFQVMIERLGAALSGVEVTDLPTLADGLEVARLVEAAERSSRERRTVLMTEIP